MSVVLASPRLSRDIGIFHDTAEAVAASAHTDRQVLEAAGYSVNVERERQGYVEAVVTRGDGGVIIQWATDSAFRFFPLIEHDDLGLALHPFDLATNKVLALVGRLEPRDWVDVLHCHDRVQPLGYLAWAASGNDPGFSPAAILEQAARTARYSRQEIAALAFAGPPPDAADLAQKWRRILGEAAELVDSLPAREVGTCILDENNRLFTGDSAHLRKACDSGGLRFHHGCIRGAWPSVQPL